VVNATSFGWCVVFKKRKNHYSKVTPFGSFLQMVNTLEHTKYSYWAVIYRSNVGEFTLRLTKNDDLFGTIGNSLHATSGHVTSIEGSFTSL